MIAVECPVGVTISKCVTSLGERHPTLPQRPPRTPPAERRPSREGRTRDGRESARARGGGGGARARGGGGAPARERTRARRWRGSPARRRRGRPRVRRRARGGGGLTCVGARRRCLGWQDGRMGGWEGGKGVPFRERRREEGREGGRGDAVGRTRENESVERGGRRTDELRARPRRSAWQPTPPPPARAFPQASSIPRFSGR